MSLNVTERRKENVVIGKVEDKFAEAENNSKVLQYPSLFRMNPI